MIRDLMELARVCGGVLEGHNAGFGAVTSDTRSLEPGTLFVALCGDRFDGHDFVSEAAARGAAGVLVGRPVAAEISQVIVPDTLAALTAFAKAWRSAFEGTVIGLTGSNGKTTVKEMIGAVLSNCGPCLVTRGNLGWSSMPDRHTSKDSAASRVLPVRRANSSKPWRSTQRP
jgi:UDP-N-acetylmuramoyl-tripeptide--D-alanyl-D-alanine ligase